MIENNDHMRDREKTNMIDCKCIALHAFQKPKDDECVYSPLIRLPSKKVKCNFKHSYINSGLSNSKNAIPRDLFLFLGSVNNRIFIDSCVGSRVGPNVDWKCWYSISVVVV